ncbi:hypothetical protein IKG50_02175 [Candidatus Saccharibacteria bacterium]|nr:hypothetical protein [Candidatus Saccharibacteria bacterium]
MGRNVHYIKNSVDRDRIGLGTIVEIFGHIGVVYADEARGIYLNCQKHGTYMINPAMLKRPVRYRIIDESEFDDEVVLHGAYFDFKSNVDNPLQ